MRKSIGGALLLLVTLVLMLGTISQGWKAPENADGDLNRLLLLATPVMATDKKITIKHTSAYRHYSSKAEFLQTARYLSSAFQLPSPSDVTRKQDLWVYTDVLIDSDTVHATLLWIGFPDGSTQVSLTSETMQESGIQQLRLLQNQWTAELQGIGLRARWNVMIQGKATDSTSPSQSLQLLADSLQAQELARYQDAGSLSISYHSPMIRESEIESKEPMNLQIAVHLNSITYQPHITIATPAISIEY
jgi:hypothetical protein